MMLEQLAFDYNALDSETRIVVQQRTTEIKALMQSLEAAAGTLESEIKEAGFAEFLEMKTSKGRLRPKRTRP